MMTFAQYEESLRYVRWTPADAEALRLLTPHVRPLTGAIAEEFYERIREHPEAERVFRDEAQVRRLQETLQRWILELLEGPHDERYFDQRCRIGAVHAKIGVAQRYVSTAMTLVRLSLLRIVDSAFATAPESRARARVALGKILDVELTIILETYRASLVKTVARIEQLERAGIVRKLAQAEERYRDAIESAQAVCIVLDREHVTLWNRRAAELIGYEKYEILGTSALDLIVPDDEARHRILNVTPEAPVTFQSPLRTRSGRLLHVRWFVSATRDPALHKPTLYVLAVDITDVREAEQRARQTERLAAVGTMAAGLAHEIRNPLNAASLHVQLLSRALAQMPEAPVAAVDATVVLRDEISRLSALVTEFLHFARPRPLDLSVVDLGELVASVAELLGPDAATSGVSIVFPRPTRVVWATCDMERIRQVLINLVRNAIEALGEGDGGRATLRVRRVGTFAELDVEDNGPGVAPDAPIFDAFYTTKPSGTGLGLAIVHRIVGDHGGVLTLQSDPGHTVFTVRLPAASRDDGTMVALFAARTTVVDSARGTKDATNRRGETTKMSETAKRALVLVVDDEANARRAMKALLEQEGFEVVAAADGAEALEKMAEHAFDIVVTDLKMPKIDGLELLRRVKSTNEDLPVLVVTAFGAIDSAIRAMRAGAEDYLQKPVQVDELVVCLEAALKNRKVRAEVRDLRGRLDTKLQPESMVGESQAMQTVFKTVAQVAPTRASVLITGESGTGKELIAQAIHNGSPRRSGPFVKLHCAALAESLLESELFGHEKGSFTGAQGRREGRFKQADGGTLFLDEIGEIPAATQVKLLRFLQERAFERVGGNETVRVDVRVIAATNRRLEVELREGRFREDLYYRLNVVSIEMPPLRIRPGDVLALAEHFLRKYAAENDKKVRGISAGALKKLTEHTWPGNVRELENVIERAVVMCQEDEIRESDIPASLANDAHAGVRIPGSTFGAIERHAILSTLEAVGWSTTRAARMLEISVRTIQYRLNEYGLGKRTQKEAN